LSFAIDHRFIMDPEVDPGIGRLALLLRLAQQRHRLRTEKLDAYGIGDRMGSRRAGGQRISALKSRNRGGKEATC
jgi:hypothetical protein